MKMAWLAGRDAAWADELDFVGPRVRTAPWAWAVLLFALLACTWTWYQVERLDADMRDAQQVLKRLERAKHQEHIDALAKTQSSAKGGGAVSLSLERARHAAQLAQYLAYPWLTTLEQVEASAQAEQAVMLSFSLDLATLGAQADSAPEVHVEAAIKDDDAALRWAHAQGPTAQLLKREKLAAPFVTALGSYEWRAQASWAGAQP
ncbi:MAG: hypothetical protein EPO09_17745 [Aquabacterium sp.]|uniref:hypothetical protein n=1 Tax=Aquabacterium sp. TaxID=1872578 RepID=UPI001210980F|nr:hypothetical protein [Aquabacterium sp.]TAK88740.1 MAG: hypothetical protein EPO09_17745 [Aquabacterium sp.]